jgi:type VI secretion system protein ImpH
MARSRRTSIGSVIDELYAHPYRFEFFQAVRLLWLIRGNAKPSYTKQVGQDGLPEEEPVCLRCVPSHGFPATEVTEINTDIIDSVPTLAVATMGLYGAMGVLPSHDTQRLIDNRRVNESEIAFLDIFNHRILSFFYQAWAKHSLPTNYQQSFQRFPNQDPNQGDLDLISTSLLSLAGVGIPSSRNRLGFADSLFAFFSGHFSRNPKCSSSLEQMLEAILATPVSVHHFIGQWLQLDEITRSELASPNRPFGQSAQLGSGFILGDRVWDIASKFRVTLGPLNYEQMLSYCPWNGKLERLFQFVRCYVGHQLEFDVQLEIEANQIPAMELSGKYALGANCWLIHTQPSINSKEATFERPYLNQDFN